MIGRQCQAHISSSESGIPAYVPHRFVHAMDTCTQYNDIRGYGVHKLFSPHGISLDMRRSVYLSTMSVET